MPLFEYRCLNQHGVDHYYHKASYAPEVTACTVCGAETTRLVALPNVLQYFSESSGRVIQNLDPSRTIHSHAEHQRLMKQRGLEPATTWHTSNLKQTDGLTTKSRPGVKTLY